MQLIQYEPTTEKVDKRPLLVIPPWINKYYILDLREKNSFLKWATDQGLTVFVISWVNPDEKLAAKSFEDYMAEGPLAALDAIRDATGEKSVNVIGYCLGGTLLAATLSWMAARKDKRFATATFFTTMVDFTEAGELGVFIDEEQLQALEARMNERGYLDGSAMSTTFNMLRANDLIWSFVVNNYLLGKEPFPFDLLFWNGDSTRMPAAMHSFYLRRMYQENRLVQPGGITLKGCRSTSAGSSCRSSSCRRARTISRPGSRPMRRPSSIAARSPSASPHPATSRAWSTRPPATSTATGKATASRPPPTNGWPAPRRCRAPGGRTGANGCGPMPAARSRRASPAPASCR